MASVIIYEQPGRSGSTWSGMGTPYAKKPLPPIELRKNPKHGLWVWDKPKVKKPAKPGRYWSEADLQPGRLLVAGSHALVKPWGEDLNVTWSVRNNGALPGISRLWLYALGNGGLVLETPQVTIMPGATVSLSLSWPVDLPPGSNSMYLIMADQSPGATESLAEHQFTVAVLN